MSSLSSDSGSGPSVVAASSRPQELAVEVPRGALIGAGIVAVLVLWVFWHFILSQARFAIRYQADWGHTLVIPLIAGYFVYLMRHRLAQETFRTTWIALVPIIVGIAWYMFCLLGPIAVRHHNLQGAGLTITLFGIALLFFGFRAMLLLWFPLLYLCTFGQTISDRLMTYVTYPLQDLTARGSWVVLNLIAIDTDRCGNILTVFHDGEEIPLNIAEACSGMRMLMAFLALGMAMAYTGFRRLWQQVALVALGIPIAIIVNVLRVVTLAILSLLDSDFAAGDFHTFVGLLWLIPAVLMYLGVIWMLRHLVIEEPTTRTEKGDAG